MPSALKGMIVLKNITLPFGTVVTQVGYAVQFEYKGAADHSLHKDMSVADQNAAKHHGTKHNLFVITEDKIQEALWPFQ